MTELSTLKVLRALSNESRFQIMEWIMDPTRHFPPQRDGDLITDGVCLAFITEKIALTQPTVTAHMQVLAEAELVTAKRLKNWVFYRPNRPALRQAIQQLAIHLRIDNLPVGD